MSSVATIESRIFTAAKSGTSVNKGVPDQLAKLIVSQTKHETATVVNGTLQPYTSNAFTLNNNAIGYKYVGSRYQVGPGIRSSEGDNFGDYADYTDSVKELIDWIYRRQTQGLFPADLSNIKTADQYAQLLKSAGYYGDNQYNYAAGLHRWFKANVKEVAAVGGMLLLGVAGYLVWHWKKNAR